MDADRWPLVKAHFHDALDAEPDARAGLLATLDDATRAEVEAMLGAAEATDGLLDVPLDTALLPTGVERAGPHAPDPAELGTDGPLSGEALGPYRLGPRIGRGGMGDVYRAHRADGLFDRAVALKVVRDGADTEAVLARFAAERRILGSLEHPGIARLIAAGAETAGPAAGRPWLALELVDGAPLTEATAGLDARARVALLADVAEAVHHAHRRLVVHRDLKPSNVLVALDEGGMPSAKLLDFGIAKLLDPAQDPALTELSARTPMTRAYAAPEQVRGETVTTATDVYGLGLLLFEALAGRRPFEVGRDVRALETAILTEAPPLPSLVTDPGAGGLEARVLRGDLDVICHAALAKAPEARYASAEALAADLRRWLASEPIEARPPSAAYRARRFVQRHRLSVAAAALAALAVGVGLASTLWQAQQVRAEAARSAQTADFLATLFEGADPTGVAAGDTLSALDLLDRGARRIERELAGQPATRADLTLTIGRAYLGLGETDSAQAFARRALALCAPDGGAPDAGDAVRARTLLGQALAHDRPDQTRRLFAETLPLARRAGDPEALLDLYAAIGEHLLPRPDDVVAALEDGIRLAQRLDGDDSPRVGRLQYYLSEAVPAVGEHGRSEGLLLNALARQRAATDPAGRAITLTHLAGIYRYSGRAGEALPLAQESLALRRRIYGDDDLRTARALSELAGLHLVLGQQPEDGAHRRRAEALAREALATGERIGSDVAVYEALLALQSALGTLGLHREAAEASRRALRVAERAFGPDDFEYATTLRSTAWTLDQAGLYAEAAPLWTRTIARQTAISGEDAAATIATLFAAGHSAARGGQAERADRLYRRAFEASRSLPETSRTRATAALFYGRFLLDQGQAAGALGPLRAAAGARVLLGRPGVIVGQGVTSDGDRAVALLGEALLATGAATRARPLLADAARALTDSLGADHPDARRAQASLARAGR